MLNFEMGVRRMKRILAVVMTLALCFALASCYGEVELTVPEDAEVVVGTAELYSDKELRYAFSLALNSFATDTFFRNCKLRKMYYDPEAEETIIDIYTTKERSQLYGFEPENLLVIMFDFRAPYEPKPSKQLVPKKEYTQWHFVFARGSKGQKWRVAEFNATYSE
jgi:hypothetical protein